MTRTLAAEPARRLVVTPRQHGQRRPGYRHLQRSADP